jgi:hypothetical protein
MAHRRRADFFFAYSLAERSTAPSTSTGRCRAAAAELWGGFGNTRFAAALRLAALTFSVTHARARDGASRALRWPTGAAPISFSRPAQ